MQYSLLNKIRERGAWNVCHCKATLGSCGNLVSCLIHEITTTPQRRLDMTDALNILSTSVTYVTPPPVEDISFIILFHI